jgi:hypothetical protein
MILGVKRLYPPPAMGVGVNPLKTLENLNAKSSKKTARLQYSSGIRAGTLLRFNCNFCH